MISVLRMGIALLTPRTSRACWLAALVFAFAPNASAQQSGSGASDPGQVQRRITDSATPAVKTLPKILTAPKLAPAAPPANDVKFVLVAVVIEGATVFPPTELGPLYVDFLARQIELKQVETILRRITQKYRDAGYILSIATAPPQDLTQGILIVKVVEGYIDRVKFAGGKGKTAALERYADKLKAARPLTLDKLERYTLLINDLSGFTVDPALTPIDEAKGTYELTLNLDYKAVDGVVLTNNRGTPDIGRLQGWASAGVNSVLGLRERMQFGFFSVPNNPAELKYYELTYAQPIDAEGTTMSLKASLAEIAPGGSISLSDVQSTAERIALTIWHPLIRARDENLWLTGAFEFRNFKETTLGQTSIDDNLRTTKLRASYWRADDFNGSTNIVVEATVGLDILGATDAGDSNLSRSDGRGDFFKLAGEITRQQGISEKFGLQLAFAWQWSPDSLLSSEEFAIGGSRFGRGYDFFEITGESGFAFSLEPWFGENLRNKWLTDYQIYAFFDFGAVWNDVAGGNSTRDSISSAGSGVRVGLIDNLKATLEIAKPLTRTVFTAPDDNLRFFFSLTKSF
jgi:hemolysin activation/secretion protein